MAYRRLWRLRSPTPCPRFWCPPPPNRAKVSNAYLPFKSNANLGPRSFGTFTKTKEFLQWFNKPWFSRIFRVFRMSSLLFAVGGAAYTYGQITLLEDPFAHQQSVLYQVLASLNAQFCVIFLDNEDLRNNKVGGQFCRMNLLNVRI